MAQIKDLSQKFYSFDDIDEFLEKNTDDVKNFIIVRHPFDRLVSAFRDKIERLHEESLDKDWYFKLYGKHAVQYRAKAKAKFGPNFLR